MPDEVVRESDLQPRASAGLVNQGSTETVPDVGPVYGNVVEATAAAALSKRDADQAVLNK